jgi:hypothetical protein
MRYKSYADFAPPANIAPRRELIALDLDVLRWAISAAIVAERAKPEGAQNWEAAEDAYDLANWMFDSEVIDALNAISGAQG